MALAVIAGEFDPPDRGDRELALGLARRFGSVVILPTPSSAPATLPVHRAFMTDMNFRGLPGIKVILDDLERDRRTAAAEYGERFGESDVWEIHAGGTELRNVTTGEEERLTRVVPSAKTVRAQLMSGELDSLLPEVAAYIRRHGLYRPTPPTRESLWTTEEPRLSLCYDRDNAMASALAARLKKWEHKEPNIIAAVGGDGTMLRAIRSRWRERLPFYGFNTGHVGFLLNDASEIDLTQRELRLHQLPLLWVETLGPDGRHETLAFNDAWIERKTGQSAWVSIAVNGVERVERMVADGVLVATAAGSTSYARAMGATPLPFNAPLLTLAGSNVFKPEFWHPAVLAIDTAVNLKNLDPHKRPLQGYVDGRETGEVHEMHVRVSKAAAVELLFAPEHDPVSKLATLQFPQPGKMV